MLSAARERLNEAHCLSVLCAHPCCWESAQRVADGVPRLTTRTHNQRSTNTEEESFPSLNVVNVSEWVGGRNNLKFSSDDSESTGSLGFSCLPVVSQKETLQKLKKSDPSSALLPADSISQSAKSEKEITLNTAYIRPLSGCKSPWGPGCVVFWVPNPHYVPTDTRSTMNRSKSPHYTVKELICLPAFPLLGTPKAKSSRIKVKRSGRLQMTCPPTVPDPACKAGSNSDLAEIGVSTKEERATRFTGLASARKSKAEENDMNLLAEARIKCRSFQLRSRSVVFHGVEERRDKRMTKDASTSLYKLDNKSDEESINWENLRRQTFLRRRQKLPQRRDRLWGGYAPQHFDIFPVPKSSSSHPVHSLLSVVPAVWSCEKGTWRYDRCRLPLLSESTNRQSTTAETHTTSTASAVGKHKPVYRECSEKAQNGAKLYTSYSIYGTLMLNADESLTENIPKRHIIPLSSELHSGHGVKREETVVNVSSATTEETDPTHKNIKDLAVNSEPCRLSGRSDRASEPRGYPLSTPPPSLCST